MPLVHADAYRLEHAREVADLDIGERDDAVTLIEWGNRLSGVLTGTLAIDEYLEVWLDGVGDDDREITPVPCGPSWQTRLATVVGG